MLTELLQVNFFKGVAAICFYELMRYGSLTAGAINVFQPHYQARTDAFI